MLASGHALGSNRHKAVLSGVAAVAGLFGAMTMTTVPRSTLHVPPLVPARRPVRSLRARSVGLPPTSASSATTSWPSVQYAWRTSEPWRPGPRGTTRITHRGHGDIARGSRGPFRLASSALGNRPRLGVFSRRLGSEGRSSSQTRQALTSSNAGSSAGSYSRPAIS